MFSKLKRTTCLQMADKYRNFAELAGNEDENADFQIRSRVCHGTPVVIAPHGGGIEPGTSELADAVAGADLSFYAFEGTKRTGNGALHVTSGRFDEPQGIALVAASPRVVALHGENSRNPIVFLGGLDKELGATIRTSLEVERFVVRHCENLNLQGLDKNNICNRGQTGRGVQLELSYGLRSSLFCSLTKRGRQHPTAQFFRFVSAVRSGLI
jgi:phage replication-related protein YjqB (UPF0714/DUF867 family)